MNIIMNALRCVLIVYLLHATQSRTLGAISKENSKFGNKIVELNEWAPPVRKMNKSLTNLKEKNALHLHKDATLEKPYVNCLVCKNKYQNNKLKNRQYQQHVRPAETIGNIQQFPNTQHLPQYKYITPTTPIPTAELQAQHTEYDPLIQRIINMIAEDEESLLADVYAAIFKHDSNTQSMVNNLEITNMENFAKPVVNAKSIVNTKPIASAKPTINTKHTNQNCAKCRKIKKLLNNEQHNINTGGYLVTNELQVEDEEMLKRILNTIMKVM